ncbi:MAG: 3-methyl-2-oxobutanoate dehydrogenase subunit VorB, partial [Spirochaetales bacterium]|nr:3-methyl-2-oxobutanoate dehydrogenase subunit VorB [Spirochaetales bacterium]
MSNQILMKGNEALGEAAIIAGCRFYFGYPITPQNEIPAYMARRLPKVGGTFIQAESELAAINMVFGAAAAGARAMTSSSSPGISLKQEGLSYIAGAELPCVVVNIMRGGPGLGSIAGSQGDYFQSTRGGGNGDYRQIVLAPANVQELADLTVLAFDLADEYRIGVLILGDGYLGQISEALTLPEPTGKNYEKPWALTGAKGRKPNKIASLRLVPESSLEELNLILDEKYKKISAKECRSESYLTEDAEYLLVAYGTSSRICREAVNELREEGIKVGLFRLITAWPFPAAALQKASEKAKKIITVEMSLGQMIE